MRISVLKFSACESQSFLIIIDHLWVKVFYVPTADQLADGFTKPLDKPKFRSWSNRLMGGVGDEYMR